MENGHMNINVTVQKIWRIPPAMNILMWQSLHIHYIMRFESFMWFFYHFYIEKTSGFSVLMDSFKKLKVNQ